MPSTTASSEEAKDLGITMNLVEAGGYTNLSKQISQIEDCVVDRRAGGGNRRHLAMTVSTKR